MVHEEPTGQGAPGPSRESAIFWNRVAVFISEAPQAIRRYRRAISPGSGLTGAIANVCCCDMIPFQTGFADRILGNEESTFEQVYLMNRIVVLIVFAAVATGLFVLSTNDRPRAASAATQVVPADTLTRPLRLLMVGLGQDMSRVNDGIWHEDFTMIEKAADAIAEHPRITADEMLAIQNALGNRFAMFVGHDRMVHDTATRLATAAKQESMIDVMRYHSELTQFCVACHTNYRTEVRAALK